MSAQFEARNGTTRRAGTKTVTDMTTTKAHDPLSGYFTSVMLALLVSHAAASAIVEFVAGLVDLPLIEIWRNNTASGLFMGLVLADPVGAVITRNPWRKVVVKFVLGFALGVIIEVSLIRPFAGQGMSRFLFLFIATLLVPVIYSLNRMHIYLRDHDTDLQTEIARYGLWVMGWADRALIVVIMATSFAGFWLFSPQPLTTIICMALVLLLTTLYVIYARIEEDDPWLEILPEDLGGIALTELARDRLAHLASTLFPGAFLLGAAMHVAVYVLLTIFPNIGAQLNEPVDAIHAVAVVGATGLGIVFFSMLSALGFGLALILAIGRFGDWTQSRIRDRCLRLIKVMCFRPINR